MLQKALAHFNTDIQQWWGWKNLEDGEVYSNIKLNNDSATMPTEEEVNNKIQELEWLDKRQSSYPPIADQLDEIYHNGIDAWKVIIKKVKDDNPKPS
tara:strand:+ start:896 stop:1186 length:291 start_codon:yes stop_codon:yes gene_type:complete